MNEEYTKTRSLLIFKVVKSLFVIKPILSTLELSYLRKQLLGSPFFPTNVFIKSLLKNISFLTMVLLAYYERMNELLQPL